MMPTAIRWRVDKPCEDCPFNKSGPGVHLRRTLMPGRWKEITGDLMRGSHFCCHKTTDETGNGSNLVCAGAIEWQAKRGIVADYVQICERLDMLRTQKAQS